MQVATIARKNLAPMAAAIDSRHGLSGRTAAASRRCRRLGQPSAEEWRGRSALRHSVDRGARRSLRRDRLHGVVPEHAGLVRGQFRAIRRWSRDSATMFATGKILGGTGLSNPMKSFFGIEKLKLKGRKVDGGYVVRGALPWVSNLGPTISSAPSSSARTSPASIVMFLADCSDPGDHAAAVQAVPRDGRHRHLRRAVPRRLRAGRSHPGRNRRPVRQENSRRLHPAAGRHGDSA